MGKKQIAIVLRKADCSKGATLIEYQAIAAVAVFICLNSVVLMRQQAELAFVTAGTAMGGAEMQQFILNQSPIQHGTDGPDGLQSASAGGGTGESVETDGNEAATTGDPGGTDGKEGSDPGSFNEPGSGPGSSSGPGGGSGPGKGSYY